MTFADWSNKKKKKQIAEESNTKAKVSLTEDEDIAPTKARTFDEYVRNNNARDDGLVDEWKKDITELRSNTSSSSEDKSTKAAALIKQGSHLKQLFVDDEETYNNISKWDSDLNSFYKRMLGSDTKEVTEPAESKKTSATKRTTVKASTTSDYARSAPKETLLKRWKNDITSLRANNEVGNAYKAERAAALIEQGAALKQLYANDEAVSKNIAKWESDLNSYYKSTSEGAKKDKEGIEGGVWGRVGDSLADLGTDVATGIIGMGEKMLDNIVSNAAPRSQHGMYVEITPDMTREDLEKAQKEKREEREKEIAEFVAKDLYDEEEVVKEIISGTSEMLGGDYYKTKDYLNNEMEEGSILGERADAIVQSAGELIGTYALSAAGIPWWATSATSASGGEIENALRQGATLEEARWSGLVTAGAEVLTEKIGGIKFGKTGTTLTDKMLKPLTEKITSKVASKLINLGVINPVGEGAEEVLSQVISNLGTSIYKEENLDELLFSEEAMDGYLDSFIGGAVLGGVFGALEGDSNNQLSKNEQAVVDKVVADRIAEQEKDGQTIDEKQKAEIEKQVKAELEKGQISVDAIEGALGGDAYKAYQDSITNEEALQSEYDSLYKMKNGEKSDEQIDRQAELKKQLEELKTTNAREQLRQQLNDEVFAKVTDAKDSRLLESYNERARRGQAFEADLTKYDTKQQAVIQKAVDSGILNNTNRTHEFVDMVAKISADKGVLFDFTNNEKLKESGFAIDGKTVNGYVTKDGITVNMDSSKYVNSVVGHEITHVLEGTELYNELQTVLIEYAKSKGDYQTRYDALLELYKDVEGADVNAELTADLVGDYLFTDENFIKNLSTKNRNVFQKIYDEIKYLYKVATAGSKEARQLEKVKRAFDNAYRESGTAKSDTKYSLGYHAGDLGKAEQLHQQGYGRGTGHFGTGTYFVGDEAEINHGDFGKRPHHAVEFDNYNLYKAKDYKDGYALHEQLKVIDGGFSQEYYDRAVADEYSLYPHTSAYDLAESKYKTDDNSWDDAFIPAYQEIADSRGIEYKTAEEWSKENNYPADDEWFAADYSEYLKDTVNKETEEAQKDYAEFRDTYFKLWLRFGTKNTQKALRSVLDHQAAINPDGERNYFREQAAKADSFATVFMKSLGYEGIDVRGIEGLDNTTYGSVIYDLKGDDLAKKQAIGTAKYSLSDSDGKQLTTEQQEYFKDSKMRDENGNLKVMYHGSQDAGFHEFSGKYSDDDISFFFVDRNDVAASYIGTTETYEARTIHTAEDMNAFIEEIGAEGYEVVEKDGKFTLLYEGDRVADSKTAKGIYDEFCWYEGVGEGDANYKVYLNLTNPLVVDAEGRNWNNVSREFSQEIADKYNSLTADEKAALNDLAGWGEISIFRDEIRNATDGALASAYAKMGEDVNMYDFFTIAEDNFSAESIQQFAVKQMNTRDYAKKAKAEGYDGVIFNNIHDNGGYSNGSEGASTVAIAFESNQIKSVANEKPTADADIRYSLSEYTAEEKKAHNDAVKNHFGKTYSWNETGYLLLDGTKLDLSGKHEGAPGGYRTVDHRDIVDALGDDYGDGSYSGALVQFMREGNIRIIPEMGGINLSVRPTEAQEKALAEYVVKHRGEIVMDIDDTNGYTVVSVEYPIGTRSSKVLSDIRAWFENGTKPENYTNYSLTKNGEHAPYGRNDGAMSEGKYRVSGKDLLLETAPVQESVQETEQDAAPIVQTVPQTGTVAEDAIPDGFAPITEDEANTLAAENLASLDDADAPPEREAPYPTESAPVKVNDPFDERDWSDVGNRKVKAYMYDNPEVKPFFQEQAELMLWDLSDTVKAERGYNDEVYYQTGGEAGFYGNKRYTSEDIAYLLDDCGFTYADIEKGLTAIIEDNGAENIAAAKRIEFIINDRLLKGYKDFHTGKVVPRNEEYANLLKEKQNESRFTEDGKEAFDALMENADDYAPPVEDDFAPIGNVAPVETVAPVKTEAAPKEAYEAIRPKPTKEPRLARATPAEQARADILVDEPDAESDKPSAWSMVKDKVLDKGMVFEDLSLATGNRELQARWNSIRYAEGKAQRLIGEGNTSVNSLNSIREEVEKSGKTKELYEYLYHLHNADRMSLAERYEGAQNKPVFGDTVTAEESQKAAAELGETNPEFEQYAQEVYDYMTYLRELLVDGGVISRDTANLWAEMYPHYVPIRRSGDEGLNINVPLDTGKTGVNAPIKRATGGSRDILPLFDTMGQRTIQTYKAIAKNRFGVELKNTLGTTIESDALSLDDAIDSIDTQDGLLQEGKNGKKPTFTVFENGEKVTFEITEEMYNAIKPTSGGLAYTNKALNTVSNIRKGTLTEYNPWFLLKNAVKDVQDIVINSQHAAKTYAAIPKAIKQIATKGHWYTEYIENGGGENTYFDNHSNTFDKGNKALEIAKKVTGLSAISKANNVIEMMPRLAEYIASRESGRSVDVSMLDAARVTTNFAAGGDVTKFFNRNGVTFLNASVQGAVQQARNIREAKANGLKGWVGLAAKYLAAGLPAVMLNHLIWDDDEEYDELSDYVKQNYYIVGKYGDGQFVRIPKGRAVAVIQNAFEQVSNAATGDDEVDLKAFLDLAFTNLAPNNPVDNNILSPIADVATNEAWYGEDLVPSRLQDLPAAEQYDESTDSISRWLGEKLDYSPYKINYLLDQYSGVVGDTFLPMLTPEAESGDNSLGGNLIAPLKDMFTTDSAMNNQNVSDFYETVDELAVNANSSAATDEDVLKYKYINSVNAELGELYQRKREIQNSNLADDRKYEAVRDIQKQIVELSKKGLNDYNDVTITGKYATVGDRHYKWYEPGEDSDAEPGWQKITDEQLEKQEEVTNGLGISASEYWSNKAEYDYAYKYPSKYAVAKSVGGYDAYKSYSSELYDIKADKDEDGKSISGSRKEKVIEYVNNLDADYGTKIILFKSEYNADDTYNYEIIDYLNSREDISYEEMETILKELGFEVSADGTITW